MRIIFLGTGGAVPTAHRDNTSFLIESSGRLILVDSPGSLTQKILKAGCSPRQVSAVFLSHIHADHVYGLPSFIHSLMLENQTVLLFGSEETISFCLQLLDLFNLRKEKILCRVEPRVLHPEIRSEIFPGLAVTGFIVPHHSSSLAFLFETQERKILYSGDTPVYPPLFEIASRADILVHDCSVPFRYFELLPFLKSRHSNSLELGKTARAYGVKYLVPCHFFSDLDFSMEEIEAEIRENYEGQLFLPSDFSELEW